MSIFAKYLVIFANRNVRLTCISRSLQSRIIMQGITPHPNTRQKAFGDIVDTRRRVASVQQLFN